MALIIDLISVVFTLLWLLVLIHVILSWILSPWHDLRRFVDSLVEPMLAPIRRVLPQTAGIDFSPLVLLIVLDIFRRLLVGVLVGLA